MLIRRTKRALFALVVGVGLVLATWLALVGLASPQLAAAAPIAGVRFVDQNNKPISGQVRVLCYATAAAGNPLADIMVTTSAGIADLPKGCDYLAAMHQLWEQPSGKPNHGPAFRVYATSWKSDAANPIAARGDIQLRPDQPLVLFNVVASLAWEPAAGSDYVAELREGLRQASAYLYDLTEGRMALGQVAIHTDGERWFGADLRFLAANDQRPTAHVGGIVTGSTSYNGTKYHPGATFYGRYWDGDSAVAGDWSASDGYRTIIHEWLHYAMFLFDEYQQITGAETYCTCDTLPDYCGLPPGNPDRDLLASAMAFHYTASELWSKEIHGDPSQCALTDQAYAHAQSDWDTLRSWNDILSLVGVVPDIEPPDPNKLSAGPELGLVADLFSREPGAQIYLPLVSKGGPASPPPTGDSFDLTVALSLDDPFKVDEPFVTHVYHLDDPVAGAPDRVLHQGSAITDPLAADNRLGRITLLGVDNRDRIWMGVDHYTTDTAPGGRFSVASDISLISTTNIVTATTDPWTVSLDAKYEVSGSNLTTMTIVLTTPPGAPPLAQLCAVEAAIGCPPAWKKNMTSVTPGSAIAWTTAFTPLNGFDALPRYLVLRLTEPGGGEMIRWIKDGGGVGPAHDGGAPLLDGPATVKTEATISVPKHQACNRVMIMPAASYDALKHPVTGPGLFGISGLLGTSPLDLDVLMPKSGACPQSKFGDHSLPAPIVVTLYYDQAMVDRIPGITNEDSQLKLLHFVRSTGNWSVLDNPIVNADLNWVAAPVSVNGAVVDGIFAIGWGP